MGNVLQVASIFNTSTHSCLDGTPDCPVTGTLGSWGFYVLGIFMACVYLLGPNTNFGQSEQNPAFWLQLLLSSKQLNTKVTWFDPVHNETRSRILYSMDWRIWIRFLMSFLINGIGFHILVHALPIQVAGQSSLVGVVFRAVGMMYLVDLDDTPGYEMTLVNKSDSEVLNMTDTKTSDDNLPETTDEETGVDGKIKAEAEVMDEGEMATLAQKIIADAQAKLDALSSGKGIKGKNTNMPLLSAAAGQGAELENEENVSSGDSPAFSA